MKISNPLFWYRLLCKKAYEAGFKLGQDKANEHGFEQGYKHGWAVSNGAWKWQDRTVYDHIYHRGIVEGRRLSAEVKPQPTEEFNNIKKLGYDLGFHDGQNTRRPAELEAIENYQREKIESKCAFQHGYNAGYAKGKDEGITEGATIQREQAERAMREARQMGYHEGWKAQEKKFFDKARQLRSIKIKTVKLLNR